MKRYVKLCLLLVSAILLSLSLAACGGGEGSGGGNQPYEFTEESFSNIDKTLYLYNGHYYAIYEESINWVDAEVKCEAIGGHLVTVTSEGEAKFITELIKKMGINDKSMPSFHAGGFKDTAGWVWITGESVTYQGWGYGQPDNSGNRLAIWNAAGTWDDLADGLKRYYICEWESREDVGGTSYYLTNKIENIDDLKKLEGSSDSYVLWCDLDLSGIDEWEPIRDFSGKLDGLGHKITGLTVDSTNSENLGLFANVSGEIKNLTIENASISARGKSERAGILAGTSSAVIENVTVSGSVSAKYYDYVGGIVGYADGGKIIDCTNNASVEGANITGGIAGLIAIEGSDCLADSVNNGSVNAEEKVGGIAGVITAKNVSGTHMSSGLVNFGEINGETYVGGIAGSVYGAHFVNSGSWIYNYFDFSLIENNADITATDAYAGGLIGHALQLKNVTVSKNVADVTGGDYVGGFVGYAEGAYIDAKDAPNNSMITGKTYVGGFAGYAGIIENAVNNGQIRATALKDGKTYLGGVAGYCEGLIKCENTSDITSEASGKYTGGLAGYVRLKNADSFKKNKNSGSVTGADCTGGIVGSLLNADGGNTYNVTDSVNDGAVSGGSYVGGIAGSLSGAHFVSGASWIYNYITTTVLENNGEITASGDYVGGIYGYGFKVSESNTCYNNANVSGGSYVGGIAGWSEGTHIYATGETNENTIAGKSYVGGFAGYAGVIEEAVNNGVIISRETTIQDGNSVSYVGGIAGYCTGIIKCENNSDITVTTGGRYVGGIAGYVVTNDESSISGNENNGIISASDYTGGIVGYALTKGGGDIYNITGNTNNCNVNGASNVGGIAGYASGVDYVSGARWVKNYFAITYCENLGEVSGTEKVGGIVGGYGYLNTEQIDTNTDVTDNKLGVQ